MFALLLALFIPFLILYIKVLWKFVTSPDFALVAFGVGVLGDSFAKYMEASMNGQFIWIAVFVIGGIGAYLLILVGLFSFFPLFSYVLNFLAIFGSGFFILVIAVEAEKTFIPELPVLSSNPHMNLVIYSLVAIAFYMGCFYFRMNGLRQWTGEAKEVFINDDDFYISR